MSLEIILNSNFTIPLPRRSQKVTTIAKPSLDIQKIRADFPILSTEMNGKPLVFLDSGASSQKPNQVLKAMDDYYQTTHSNVHRGVYKLSQDATDLFEESRRTMQRFINAKHDHEVIFTRGTTEGINLVANCFGRKFLKEGDEVLISAMEHHSNIVPWQMACEASGAVLKVVPLNDLGELDFDAFDALITKKTKIISIMHVSNSLGTINPIKEITRVAHERNVPILVDGAQACPHMKIDVQDLDVDFYVASAHKMYGPTGMGFLYGKEEWLNKLPPYHGGGEMIETCSFEKTTYNVLPFKFEAGTPDIAGAIGMAAAADYILELGHEIIGRHEDELLEYATDKLSEIEGLKIIGNAKNKASVVSFIIEGTHPYDVGAILDKLGIAVRTGHHCTQPLMELLKLPGTVRASFGVYNTKEDIDILVAGVKRAARMLM